MLKEASWAPRDGYIPGYMPPWVPPGVYTGLYASLSTRPCTAPTRTCRAHDLPGVYSTSPCVPYDRFDLGVKEPRLP